jgi:hypothetical protein
MGVEKFDTRRATPFADSGRATRTVETPCVMRFQRRLFDLQ